MTRVLATRLCCLGSGGKEQGDLAANCTPHCRRRPSCAPLLHLAVAEATSGRLRLCWLSHVSPPEFNLIRRCDHLADDAML